MRLPISAVLAASAVVALTASLACAPNRTHEGLHGPHRFDDGRIVSIGPSVDDTLRVREYRTGASWRLHPDGQRFVSGPGFAERDPVSIEMRLVEPGVVAWTEGSATTQARRLGIDEWSWIDADDAVRLRARLALPEGEGPHPAVVLVHGSGEDAGTRWLYPGDFFVANGIAALTYDKRGTGESSGEFTMDFEVLARDAVSVAQALAEHPAIDPERIGVSGYSQGAWVAPLAASMHPEFRYVQAHFGMVHSPAEEARLETLQLARDRGVVGEDLEDIDAITRAAVAVVAAEFTAGWTTFDALKREHRRADWRPALKGSPVASMMRVPKGLVKLAGKKRLPPGLRWDYDSTALLETLDTPSAWFLGGRDQSAPPDPSIQTLRKLAARGRPIELTVYPEADHGMLVFEERDGEREYTGYAPGYWPASVEAAARLSF